MTAYVELHCHSNFSLLDGASHPEDLIVRAKEIGMPALAITDHNGLYGAVRFYKAAREQGIKPLIGAELTLEQGDHITLLVKDNNGYTNLCRLITKAQLGHNKGSPSIESSNLVNYSDGLICLSGCKKGQISSLMRAGKKEQAKATAAKYLEIFGRDNFFVELQDNLYHGDRCLCQQLVDIAKNLDVRYVATNNVHYATRDKHRLYDVLVCIRNRTGLDKSGRFRRSNCEFYIKSAAEMSELFADYPEALESTIRVADKCYADLNFSSYRFPDFPLPNGETAQSYLGKLCWQKAKEKYGELSEQVKLQVNYELELIEKLGLSGYFLIVWDIMDYAKTHTIPAQGRGSAANSIIAYILGITKVDPIRHNLFVGRFINEEMSSLPDIDIDVSTNHREQLIQYVYQKYGEEHTAMVCTYVTFQARNAIREVGKALGMPADILDQMAKAVGAYGARDIDEDLRALDRFHPYVTSAPWQHFVALCREIADFPRHLSIHVGGMIISSRPLTAIVPLEHATMPGRVVCQWDKDSVEDAGLVKVDILGLRMLSLIQEVVELIKDSRNIDIDLEKLPIDDGRVYDVICQADTMGVFQVESRAQMQTLPRTKPRSIEDLTVEVAIIRPGPLQGNMVNPYINRRQGKEKVTYPHQKLKPILEETLGVILFQEQVLRCAIAAAGFSPGEADSLRRAMSRKRSQQAMEDLRCQFRLGALKNGISERTAMRIFDTLKGFAEYGFCKSHAAGFALLAYQSAWLKYYYPAEFYAALLNNQPMGFYTPEVIVGDAKRHGVKVLPVDINHSQGHCTIEDGTVRLGLRYVNKMGERAIASIQAARKGGQFSSLADFYSRTRLSREAIENLILAGVMDSFKVARRRLLWDLGVLECSSRNGLMLDYPEYQVPLPGMTDWEEIAAEYSIQGFSARLHPMQIMRGIISKNGVSTSSEALALANGNRVRTAGYVVCRQAPRTSKGHVFLALEDEEGLLNIILKPHVYQQYRYVVRTQPLLIVDGILQKREGITNIIAKHIVPLQPNHERDDVAYSCPAPKARNFC